MMIDLSVGEIDLIAKALALAASRRESLARSQKTSHRASCKNERTAAAMRKLRSDLLTRKAKAQWP